LLRKNKCCEKYCCEFTSHAASFTTTATLSPLGVTPATACTNGHPTVAHCRWVVVRECMGVETRREGVFEPMWRATSNTRWVVRTARWQAWSVCAYVGTPWKRQRRLKCASHVVKGPPLRRLRRAVAFSAGCAGSERERETSTHHGRHERSVPRRGDLGMSTGSAENTSGVSAHARGGGCPALETNRCVSTSGLCS